MICAFISRSSRGLTPFTEPCVPTGINAGVSITPCAVVDRPCRAFDCRSGVKSSKFFCIRTRDSSTSLGMTNAAQNILCEPRFSLYIRDSPHRSVRDFFARRARERLAWRSLSHCARHARCARCGWTAARSLQIWSEAPESRRSEGSRTESSVKGSCGRKEIILNRKIENVATKESLQKGRARRFPLWESGSGPAHQHCDEARQEVARGADCLHSN